MTLIHGKPAPVQSDFLALPEPASPAALFDADFARRALDDLFFSTQQYATGAALDGLFQFMRQFRFYSPFNAMLLHVQNPGTSYAAPASRWKREHGRVIKPGARPLVILQPMGPVMFVFDVSDTEPAGPDSPPLPRSVTDPFEPKGNTAFDEYTRLRFNAIRDGVQVVEQQRGSGSAGQVSVTSVQGSQLAFSEKVSVIRRYDIVLNAHHSVTARFSTLVHELAHLYCGHLGLPFADCKWWPDRTGLELATQEFEAESITYLVCIRLGVEPPSAEYLAGYLGKEKKLPQISLERILVAAGLIEKMCGASLPPGSSPKRL
jgi:hypothetical protein